MFSYKFILDLHKDLKNWVDGANKVSHGRNWKENVAPEYLHIVEKLQGISYTEAEVFMVPFLEELYEEKKETIKLTFEYANQLFEAKFQRACETIEQMTGNPLYREDFIIFLTSFPR
ncbi:MAG: hypothetical protein LBU27_02150 [Candidatus Peribacteria bacterium]|jgi:hypothetical protein|nr:hypothetical protein [Candidatus Peribacteria bacterium]